MGEPGCATIRICHHPGAGGQRESDDDLAPLEGVFRACCQDGSPYQQREHADLQCRERGCQPGIHSDENRYARCDERTAEEVCPEQAIFLRKDYAITGLTRAEMVHNKEKLLEIGGVMHGVVLKWNEKK